MNLNEIYFKDNFTKEGDKVNLEVNKLTAECITSKNNKFGLDSEGNLTVQSITTIDPISQTDINSLYPVGSIYMNVNLVNPSEIFGGTWEQIQDRFLLACGNTYANGTFGGEATHTLTINEMPSHNHIQSEELKYSNTSGWWIGGTGGTTVEVGNYVTTNTGGSKAHNNMPPYLAVYIWKRVA